MRKIGLFSLLIAVLGFASCSMLETVAPGNVVQAPKFTTIDKILKLQKGMTYAQVQKTLGSPAYDVFYITFDEKKTVYTWYYKKIERKEDPKTIDKKEGATSGEEVICKQQRIYITFDESGKLVNAVSDAATTPAAQKKNTDENTDGGNKKKKMFGII